MIHRVDSKRQHHQRWRYCARLYRTTQAMLEHHRSPPEQWSISQIRLLIAQLGVRGAVELANNDQLRFGDGDNILMFYDSGFLYRYADCE